MSTRIRTAFIALLLLPMSVTACGEAGTTITRLAVGDPGPDPYTLAAGAADDGRVARRAETGGQMTGDAPGLYGGTRKASSCDKDALVAFLQADAEKAGAWAKALHIRPAEIPSFVADLTPAVLRVDTLVTNHGYRNGTATAMPAVLQAGIAVLVDRKGVPVVKCNCGNPLTPPDEEIDPENSDYRGVSWPQFDDGKVTVIKPPGKELESLTLVDSGTETAFERPTGSGGEGDGEPEPIPAVARSEPPVSTSGQPFGGPATSGGPGSGAPASGPVTEDGSPGTPTGDGDLPEPSVDPAGTPPQGPSVQKPESPAAPGTGSPAVGPDTSSSAADPGGTATRPQEPEQPEDPPGEEPAGPEEPRPEPEPEEADPAGG